jgi:hypothetical protein
MKQAQYMNVQERLIEMCQQYISIQAEVSLERESSSDSIFQAQKHQTGHAFL